MKTFELVLGIMLIVAFFVLRFSRVFRWGFGYRENLSPSVVEIVLALALLASGGFMLWLWSG